MAKRYVGECCMEGCENDVEVPSTGTCKNCYSSVLRWNKRSREDIERRVHQIGLYGNRMNVVAPKHKTTMTPKKVKLKGMPGQIKYKLKNKSTTTNGKRK